MNLIYALIVSIFITTMTPPPPTPSATPAPATSVAVFSSADAASEEALQETAAVIERRLDALDVEYAAVTTEHNGDEGMAVRVELVPELLTGRVIELLTQPGYLELVDVSALELNQSYDDALIWTTGQEARFNERTIRLANEATPEPALINPETDRPFKTIVDGTEISNAEAILEANYGTWIVEITLNDEAAAEMESFTAGHIGKPLAIVIDGRILTMPVIQSAISSPLWISGNYTEAEARELAARLDGGPLPMTLEFSSLESAPLDE